MKEQQKAIDGILLIEVDLDELDRIEEHLAEIAGSETIIYRAVTGVEKRTQSGKLLAMLLYLELLGSQWEQVIPWCAAAYDAGEILSYRFAETGPMLIAAPRGATNAENTIR